ncbi:hypothetical protein BAUCODRAFT_32517 [Baudoinia panamericana UAMH 10762]|uniref:Uncharacterized protein n=1 Tax=Baudoinia panamericana (strain UAMH 10762) TaxID=717646 RepID=M2LV29_BAUPA|nr:uncharacterized protein BAUCODRAFT_32517 [Baudoinia panamericana UAMH 10762]EMC98472.1 hypothetical protein BAUCODRAFT_32517 [Baudoinia panamericana UAMH 10762]
MTRSGNPIPLPLCMDSEWWIIDNRSHEYSFPVYQCLPSWARRSGMSRMNTGG